jgi:hypothetical protein
MADKENKEGQNLGAHQGNIDNERDTKNTSGKTPGQGPEQQKDQADNSVRPADARDMPESPDSISGPGAAPGTEHMSDKGDLGRQGSMREALESNEGYRSMDEDDNVNDSLKKGDNDTVGNP